MSKKNAYGLDVDDKRALFCVGFFAAALLVVTLTIAVGTGVWGPFAATAFVILMIIGTFSAIVSVWRLAKKIFPDTTEE